MLSSRKHNIHFFHLICLQQTSAVCLKSTIEKTEIISAHFHLSQNLSSIKQNMQSDWRLKSALYFSCLPVHNFPVGQCKFSSSESVRVGSLWKSAYLRFTTHPWCPQLSLYASVWENIQALKSRRAVLFTVSQDWQGAKSQTHHCCLFKHALTVT